MQTHIITNGLKTVEDAFGHGPFTSPARRSTEGGRSLVDQPAMPGDALLSFENRHVLALVGGYGMRHRLPIR